MRGVKAFIAPVGRTKVMIKQYLGEDLYNRLEQWRGKMPRSRAIETLIDAALKMTPPPNGAENADKRLSGA